MAVLTDHNRRHGEGSIDTGIRDYPRLFGAPPSAVFHNHAHESSARVATPLLAVSTQTVHK